MRVEQQMDWAGSDGATGALVRTGGTRCALYGFASHEMLSAALRCCMVLQDNKLLSGEDPARKYDNFSVALNGPGTLKVAEG